MIGNIFGLLCLLFLGSFLCGHCVYAKSTKSGAKYKLFKQRNLAARKDAEARFFFLALKAKHSSTTTTTEAIIPVPPPIIPVPPPGVPPITPPPVEPPPGPGPGPPPEPPPGQPPVTPPPPVEPPEPPVVPPDEPPAAPPTGPPEPPPPTRAFDDSIESNAKQPEINDVDDDDDDNDNEGHFTREYSYDEHNNGANAIEIPENMDNEGVNGDISGSGSRNFGVNKHRIVKSNSIRQKRIMLANAKITTNSKKKFWRELKRNSARQMNINAHNLPSQLWSKRKRREKKVRSRSSR